jgi:hypothetical protein
LSCFFVMQRLARSALRTLSTSTASSSAAPAAPWFVDPAYVDRPSPPHMPAKPHTALPPLPEGVPRALAQLHAALADSPHLEPGTLLVRTPIETPQGPPLPYSPPKGRRMRGGTEFGEGVEGRIKGVPESGGIWSWIMLAQVNSYLVFLLTYVLNVCSGQRRYRKAWLNRIRHPRCTKDGASISIPVPYTL